MIIAIHKGHFIWLFISTRFNLFLPYEVHQMELIFSPQSNIEDYISS